MGRAVELLGDSRLGQVCNAGPILRELNAPRGPLQRYEARAAYLDDAGVGLEYYGYCTHVAG